MCIGPFDVDSQVRRSLFTFLQSFFPLCSADCVNSTGYGTARLVLLLVCKVPLTLHCAWHPSVHSSSVLLFAEKGLRPSALKEGTDRVKGRIASNFKNRHQNNNIRTHFGGNRKYTERRNLLKPIIYMFEREEKCCIHRIRVKGEHSASNTEPLEIQMMRAKRKAQ